MSTNGKDHGQRYSMLIHWSDEDSAYIVTVPELPGCVTHGATRQEAVQQGAEVIAGWLEAARAWGRPIPSPALYTPEETNLAV